MPALDAAKTIGVQLDALASQDWTEPWEVVVVDNGSTDATVQTAEGFRPRLPGLQIVDASDQPGQAAALNAGVAAARAEAVAFCDADDKVAPGWLRAMGDALAVHPLVACSSDDTKLNAPWQRAARASQPPGQLSTVSFLRGVPYAGSGGLGVRRSLHAELGGFDESLPALFDVDYCIRAHQRGVELRFVPDALLHYRYRDTIRGIFDQARSYARVTALLQRRHRPPASSPPLLRWVIAGWRPIVRTLVRVGRRAGRAELAWLLGWQLGRFEGSFRHGVRAL